MSNPVKTSFAVIVLWALSIAYITIGMVVIDGLSKEVDLLKDDVKDVVECTDFRICNPK